MKRHTKIYMDFFDIDYDIATGYYDYIDCEVDRKIAVDLHHIIPKSQGGKDDINNIIALCRSCHDKAHSGILTREYLHKIHNKKKKEFE